MASKKAPKSKKKTRKPAPNKSAFIRENSNLPVPQIIAKAAKSGIGKVTPAFCYTILSEFRKKTGATKSTAKPVPGKAPAGKASSKSTSKHEDAFWDAAIELGATRAQELLSDILARVRSLRK